MGTKNQMPEAKDEGSDPPSRDCDKDSPVEGLHLDHVGVDLVLEVLELTDLSLDGVDVRAKGTHTRELVLRLVEERLRTEEEN